MGFLSALGQATPGATSNLNTTQYGPTLASALGNYQTATTGQDQLIGQLQQIANGQGGPNLADAELAAGTQRNAAANAAAIASQRGISNPALAARQIGMGTTDANQQAVGQAAQARLAQQIAAQQELAGVLGQKAQTGVGLFGAGAGAQNAQNQGQIENQQLAQRAHETDLGASGAFLSGLGSLGTGFGNMFGRGGGGGAGGGGGDNGYQNIINALNAGGPGLATAAMAKGGTVGGMSPLQSAFMEAYCRAHGGDVVDPNTLLMAWHAGKEHAENMTDGGTVGGPPPVVPGDDERNDQTPIMASRGERVVPASISHDPMKTAAFIDALNRQEQARSVMHSSPGRMLAFRPGAQ